MKIKRPNLGPGFYKQIPSNIKPRKTPKCRVPRKLKKKRKKIDMLIEKEINAYFEKPQTKSLYSVSAQLELAKLDTLKEIGSIIDYWYFVENPPHSGNVSYKYKPKEAIRLMVDGGDIGFNFGSE